MTRYGMTDHDEMTGASAWDDWARREDDRRIVSGVMDALARGEVVGTIDYPPGSGLGGAGAAAGLASLMKRSDPLPSIAQLRIEQDQEWLIAAQVRDPRSMTRFR